MTFSVLHIKNKRPLIEPTADHSGSHVKWNVTSLSPVGPIMQTTQPVEHHGVVLLYKKRGKNNNSYSFHVYLAPNSRSEIEVSTSPPARFVPKSPRTWRPIFLYAECHFESAVHKKDTFQRRKSTFKSDKNVTAVLKVWSWTSLKAPEVASVNFTDATVTVCFKCQCGGLKKKKHDSEFLPPSVSSVEML